MVYIKGVGMTSFGSSDKKTHLLAYDAAVASLENAGMSLRDIDAVIVGNLDFDPNGERQRHITTMISSVFKRVMPIIRTPAACGSGGAALWTGNKLVENDEALANVMVLGVEKMSTIPTFVATDELMMAANYVFEQPEGMVFPAQNALVAQQHFLKYGSNSDDLALISKKNHDNAFSNPKAKFYKKRIELDTIRNSPIVASPLRLYDCSISVDGAAAVILSKDKTDIELIGSSLYTDYLSTFEREDMVTWNATKLAAQEAYKQAGLQPNDIDVVEIHDAFTIVELLSYEDLGFAEKGKGQELIRNGDVLIDGRLPVNASGGLKAKGHPLSATGVAQIVEITEQLRNESKERQVANARVGLAQNIGGAGGTASVHIAKKV